jgi:hypothetical protein
MAHLHGQTYNLRQQDSQQHQEISIADEERFHGIQWIAVSD